MPTHTTSAPEESISAIVCSSSAGVSGRNGGDCPPAIRRPGKRSRRRSSSRAERLGGATPVQVHRGAGPCRPRAVVGHQVRAVHARRAGVPERVQRPHQRLAVGHGQRGAEHRRERLGLLLRAHHEVDGRRGHVSAGAGGDHRVHPVHHLLVVGHRERNAEDLGGGRCGERSRCGGCRDGVKIPAGRPLRLVSIISRP